MITVINKANKGLYNQLFEQVQDWLYTHNQQGEEIEQFGEGALLGKTTQVVDGVEVEVPETLTSLEELFEFMFKINYLRNSNKKNNAGVERKTDKSIDDFIKENNLKMWRNYPVVK